MPSGPGPSPPPPPPARAGRGAPDGRGGPRHDAQRREAFGSLGREPGALELRQHERRIEEERRRGSERTAERAAAQRAQDDRYQVGVPQRGGRIAAQQDEERRDREERGPE